jgi:hypothetical protein
VIQHGRTIFGRQLEKVAGYFCTIPNDLLSLKQLSQTTPPSRRAVAWPFRYERSGYAVPMLTKRGYRYDVGVGEIPRVSGDTAVGMGMNGACPVHTHVKKE